jgi:LPS-assembly lipoprotein
MSWFDRTVRPARPVRSVGVGALVAVLLPLAACSVEPLYGGGPTGSVVNNVLSGLVIDPVDSKVAQDLRNRLLFDLSGSVANAPPRYRVKLTVDSSELALGVTPVQSSPAYSVTVSATYEVTSIATGQIVLRATSRQSASYDRVNQAFANERAKLDAETRAAVLAADDIHLSLSAAAASGRI